MNDRHIAPAFIVALLCSIGLVVTYALGGQPQAEGLLLFGSFTGFGVAVILWAKHYFPNNEVEQKRHHFESSPEEQKELDDMVEGLVEDVTRRKFLTRLGGAALGFMGVAALFPIKSLGDSPGESLFHTQWEKGLRLVTEAGKPVKPTDLDVGGIITVWPDNGEEKHEESSTLLIRVPVNEFKPKPGREDWVVDGNVAYSKVCTHVGCPVSLYRETTRELLCPCHQSTFDVLDHGKAVFGPATRPLPQLPLALDSQGYLIAQSDYREPVGPGFWDRNRRKTEA